MALHVPIRMAAAGATVVGAAWLFNAGLDSLGIEDAPVATTLIAGGVCGILAGLIMCVKLSDAVGFAGRTILLPIAIAIIVQHVVGQYLATAVVPWVPELLMCFVGTSCIAALGIMLRLLWIDG